MLLVSYALVVGFWGLPLLLAAACGVCAVVVDYICCWMLLWLMVVCYNGLLCFCWLGDCLLLFA